MADFYEEDFSTEYQNEDALNDMFGAADDADEEDQAFARNFDTMTPEEREQAFGNKNFFDLLTEMDDLLNSSHRFFVRNLRIVNARDFGGIIDDLNFHTPREITRGREIIADEQNIIDEANNKAAAIKADADSYDSDTRLDADNYSADVRKQADDYYGIRVQEGHDEQARIIEDARRTAEQLVSEHQITIDAKNEGERIIAEANATAQDIINTVNEKCDAYKAAVNQWCDDSMKRTAEYCYNLLIAARTLSDENIRKIDSCIRESQADYQQAKRDIGYVK